MRFNNGKERQKFEDGWKRLRARYADAGFSEEGIAAMRAFDEDAYRSRRRYEEHTLPLPSEDFHGGAPAKGRSLIANLAYLSTSFDETSFTGRHAWVDTLDDPALTFGLKRLSRDDLELLTLYVIDGYSQPEIARFLGCDQYVVSRRFSRVKKILRQVHKKRHLTGY